MKKTISIDWLELFCNESPAVSFSAEAVEEAGYRVEKRSYGTPVYNEMYKVFCQDLDIIFCEVRRDPISKKSQGGILDDCNCHVRLSNHMCYVPGAIERLQSFLVQFGVLFVNISRLDLCCDTVVFSGDMKPREFLREYMQECWYKEYQPRVRVIRDEFYNQYIQAHGTDKQAYREWNSISWGSSTSAVKTRFYNKSYEVQSSHKSYISHLWYLRGWNGKDDVWRVEFQLKGNASWKDNYEEKIWKIDLKSLQDPVQLSLWYHSIASRYFRFRKVVRLSNGNLQRKDRSPLYLPIKWEHSDVSVKVASPLLRKNPNVNELRLARWLKNEWNNLPFEVRKSAQYLRDYLWSMENAVR